MNHVINGATTLGAFIVVIGIIIFVHEFGHFISAKAFGMRVLVFSFGFGRRLCGFRWSETDCRLSLIPLGGYVKLEGEPDDLLSEKAEGADFMTRPRWQRIVMYLAGPTMNAALTITVLWILFLGFGKFELFFEKPVIGGVEPGLPAMHAGLRPGDEILEINGKTIHAWRDLQYEVALSPERDIRLSILSDGVFKTISIRPITQEEKSIGIIGVTPTIGISSIEPGSPAEKAGVSLDDRLISVDRVTIKSEDDMKQALAASVSRNVELLVYRKDRKVAFDIALPDKHGDADLGIEIGERFITTNLSTLGALGAALRQSWEWTSQIADVLRRLLSGRLSVKAMSGPLGIAKESGEKAKEGPLSFFHFLAFISLNIGILNLFPLVPLDGGHILILLVESIARRDLSLKVKLWIANIGVVLILALVLVIVFYADLSRFGVFQKFFK